MVIQSYVVQVHLRFTTIEPDLSTRNPCRDTLPRRQLIQNTHQVRPTESILWDSKAKSSPLRLADVKVMHYFRSNPRDQRPLGLSLGGTNDATALSLLQFTGQNWLDERTMSCGLDVIRRKYPSSWPRVVTGTALFGTACNPTFR